MRLGQLARKLALRPGQIVDFLSKNNITIESGSNTRIEDEHVALVMRNFAPELSEEKIVETISQNEEPSYAPSEPEAGQPSSAEEISPEIPSAQVEFNEEKIELIKAPKIELSGLRVLGKIELPEVKKKEVLPPAESIDEVPPPNLEKRKPYPQRKERTSSASYKNPIALKREREAREAEEKRKASTEVEKEKRALHYRKKIKPAPPTKRVRLIDEPMEEFSAAQLEEPPKTWFGKFLRWLNT